MGVFAGITTSYLLETPNVSGLVEKYILWAKAKEGDIGRIPGLDINPAQNKNVIDDVSGENLITFSRSGNATYVDENGIIGIASTNTLRINHDPVTGECLGVLIEEQRVNYEQNTEDPSQWTTSNMIPTGNSVTLPTGEVSTTIEYQGETTDPNSKLIRPLPTGSGITAGDTWTYSGFYKKGVTNGERYVHIVLQNNTATESTGRRFDFDTGTWATSQSLNNVTVADSGYDEYPNGWYRIWMTCTFPSAASGIQTFTRLFANSTSIPYDTSFSLWGAQLEKASFMTSYIPNNTSSTITRSADVVTIEGENFTRWYNPNEGTLFFIGNSQYVSITAGTTKGFVVINDSTSNTRIDFRQRIVNSILSSNGTNVSWSGISTPSNITDIKDSSFQKVGMSYSSNSHAQAQNGYLTRTSTTPIDPINATRLAFFVRDGQTSPTGEVGGHISRIVYWNKRLSNETLQSLVQ